MPQSSEDEADEEDGDSEDESDVRRGSAYEAAGHASMILGDKTAPSGGSLTLVQQLQLARQITLGMVKYMYGNLITKSGSSSKNEKSISLKYTHNCK